MKEPSETQRVYLREVAQRLDSAQRGQRGVIVGQAANLLGCSTHAIYAGLEAIGWKSGRKGRSDKGATTVAEKEARIVANLMVTSLRQKAKRMMSMQDAIEIARANGHVDSKASPNTFARVMRDNGFHPDQLIRPEPHIQMRSLYPNHVWQFDVSICVLYYMPNGGLTIMEKTRFYKNKPANEDRIKKDRVLRYLVTDHFSGAFYVEYFQTPGENQETLFNFLVNAFSARGHKHDPFHGVPFQLIWDKGSANESHMIRHFLDNLQVHHETHRAHNPRAKGQVERTHEIVERAFESRLSTMRITSTEELNRCAHIWMRYYNGTRAHSRTNHPRYQLWQTIREDQLRICPPVELCRSLLSSEPEERTVKGDLTINYTVKGYASAVYSVEHIPDIRVGDKVNVAVNPYQAPAIFVIDYGEDGQEVRFECDPINMDIAGFRLDAPVYGDGYARPRDTKTDTHRKAMRKEAYNAQTQLEAEKARAQRKPAFGGRVDPISYLSAQPQADYMRRKGTAIDLPNNAPIEAPALLPLIQVLKRIRHQIQRPLTTKENLAIRNRYPDGLEEEQLRGLISELSGAGAAEDCKVSQV